MRINCHTHVFNVKSVFTRHTLHILAHKVVDALDRTKWGFLADEIENLIEEDLNPDMQFTRESLRKLLAGRIATSGKLGAWLAPFNSHPMLFGVPNLFLLSHAAANSNSVASALIEGIDHLLAGPDYKGTTLSDIIDYLETGFSANIDSVTDRLMKQLDLDDITTPLMMDITDGHDLLGPAADEARFRGQMEDTSRQILRYPGRILPFVAVNPNRPNTVEFMKEALRDKGFIGVKLYPSLGYILSHPAMNKIYRHCKDNQIPITMHCTTKGFTDGGNFANCAPCEMEPIIRAYPGLKVNFAHFGGASNLNQPTVPSGSYTKAILDLMADPTIGQYVYADVAYHTEAMDGGPYATTLSQLEPRKQILWGTDYWMVRLRLRECNYWAFFEHLLNPPSFSSLFRQMTEENPLTFLGFGSSSMAPAQFAPNLKAYVAFAKMHVNDLQSKPAKWLRNALISEDAALRARLDSLPETP